MSISALVVASALNSLSFSTGYGVYGKPGDVLGNHLTTHENRYIASVQPQIDACSDRLCRTQLTAQVRDIINLRRELARFSDALFDSLRRPCEAKPAIAEQHVCFIERAELDHPAAMALAGFSRAGVTRRGVSHLRIGMNERDLNFIFGSYGEQVSYASSGGYSSTILQWRQGRALVVVSLSDGKVSGWSQSGLN